MMIRMALLRKSIHDARLLFLSSMVVIFGFCWLRVWIVTLLPMDRFRTIVEQFREFERFVPVSFEQLFTYPGRIALTYDEFVVIMGMAVWAIARGSDSVAGELDRGTMEMVASQPISRKGILLTQAMVTTLGTVLLAMASWWGLYVGIQTTTVEEPVAAQESPWTSILGFDPGALLFGDEAEVGEEETREVPMATKVNPRDMWPPAVNYFALGFFLAGLSTLISACDRYRWRTIGIVAAIYVLQLVMKIIGLASDRWSWLLKLTFFSAYDPEGVVSIAINQPADTWRLVLVDDQGCWTALGPLGFDLLLVGMGGAAYIAATIIFCRRDLPAPL
ncbi:MAG: ABC transporter permease subunit [Planctomycetota bacterium]